MPAVLDDTQVCARKALLEVPGAAGGAHDVVAPLHDGRRDALEAVGVVQEPVVPREPAVVVEEVVLRRKGGANGGTRGRGGERQLREKGEVPEGESRQRAPVFL